MSLDPQEQPTPPVSPDFFQGDVERGLERMRLRLLDLTNRNRLLNFRHSKRSSLQVVNAELESAYDRLRDGGEFHFAPVPRPPRDLRHLAAKAYAESLGIPTSLEMPQADQLTQLDSGSPANRGARRVLQTLHYPEDLEAILRRTAGAARLAIEETGVNMLYVVFGFLEWYESEDSEEPILSPLVLLPLTIRKGDPDPETRTFRYFIQDSGEDVVNNASLQERLRRDFNIELPEFDEDRGLAPYFEALRPIFRQYQRWSLKRQMTMGLFSFQKLLMYKDLDPGAWPRGLGPLAHPRVREFFEGVPADGLQFAPEHALDSEELASQVPSLIYDADSSQHSALVDALAGKNLVIEGPPGTGKSQTITNLIAAALVSGKTVLFVAEKLAALQVVRRRLDEAGLGPFCLELHSAKANKKVVLTELEDRIRLRREIQDVRGLDEKQELLQVDRKRLNDYVEVINRHFGRAGYTLHEIIWACQRRLTDAGFDVQHIARFAISGARALSIGDIAERKHLLEVLGQQFARIVESSENVLKHPWCGVRSSSLTFADEERLVDSLRDQLHLADELTKAIASKHDLLPEPPDTTVAISDLVSAIESVPTDQDICSQLLPLLNDHAIRDRIDRFCMKLEEYRRIGEEVGRVTRSDRPISRHTLDQVRRALEALSSHLSPTSTLRDVEERLGKTRAVSAAIQHVQDTQEEVFRELRCSLPCTISTAATLQASLTLLSTLPLDHVDLRHPGLRRRGTAAILRVAQAQAARLRELKARLSAEFVLTALPPLETVRRLADVCARAHWLSVLSQRYRDAKRAYRAFSRRSGRPDRRVLRDRYLELREYLEEMAEFRADQQVRQLSGPHFAGLDTAFDGLAAMAQWQERLEDELKRFASPGQLLSESLFSAGKSQLRILQERSQALVVVLSESLVLLTSHTDPEGDLPAVADRLSTLERDLGSGLATLREVVASAELSLVEINDVLARIEQLLRLQEDLDTNRDAAAYLGRHFGGAATDLDRLIRTKSLHQMIQRCGAPASVSRWLSSEQFAPRIADLRAWGHQVRGFLVAYKISVSTLTDVAKLDVGLWLRSTGAAFETTPLSSVRLRTVEALDAMPALPGWLQYLRARGAVSEANIEGLVPLLEDGRLNPVDLVPAFELVFLQTLIRDAAAEYPILSQFSGLTHERIRDRFAQLDLDVMELFRARAAYLINQRPVLAGNSVGPVSTYTEVGLIRHELTKQRRHLPLRQFIARTPRSLQALKPCFMMSPLSVAQYLARGQITFDLVVMDEASQLRPEDALGAVLRGSQMVIVGDRMQLPPTTFFDRLEADSEQDDDTLSAADDAESILDVASALYTPSRFLRWHYRSQHGSLIGFSNKEFYNGQLIVFPSPIAKSRDLGVQFVPISDGVYENRVNPVEAKRVVQGVLKHMRTKPGESLGVVTLNLSQRDVVEEEFERQLKQDIHAQSFVEAHSKGPEPFFVKNLENVQGDERDAVFISVTYGPSSVGGQPHQRFGPINGATGHRRLNVLFTRAKRRVVVFSSMTADQIVVQATSSWGVKVLKAYLAYAQSGVLEQPEGSGREPESDFEIEVASELTRHGYSVVAQLGVAGYFLDLAVKHPLKSDAYLLGIECDGAAYHSAVTARDRDRLRQAILEQLGWKIHRIWSTDWFRERPREVSRLVARIEQEIRATQEGEQRLAERQQAVEGEVVSPESTPESAAVERDEGSKRITVDEARRQLIEFRERRLRREFPAVDPTRGLLRKTMLDAVLKHRPVSDDEWVKRIPTHLREAVDEKQLRFLPEVFAIVSRITD